MRPTAARAKVADKTAPGGRQGPPLANARPLPAGVYRCGDGTLVRVADMHPNHLVNAWLKALADGEADKVTDTLTPSMTTTLAKEVVKRHLVDLAVKLCRDREGRRHR